MICSICGSSKIQTILAKLAIPIFTNANDKDLSLNKYPCNLVQCGDCGHVFQPVSKALKNALEEVYNSEHAQLSTPLGVGNWGEDRAHYSVDRLKGIEEYKNKDVLEIGCGNGYVLKLLKNLGFKSLFGIEPSIKTKQLDGISFIKSFITEETKIDLSFDFIFSFGVYEHVDDINSMTSFCSRHLNDGGMVFIYVPNCEHQLALGDFDVFAHEHIQCFVPNSLRRHLMEHGYEIIDDQSDEHAIAVYAKKINKKNIEKYTFEVFNQFESKVDRKLEVVKNIFSTSNVIVHGACNTLNNILGWLDGDFDFTLVDNDNTKHGKKYFNKIVESLSSINVKNYSKVIILPAYFSNDIKADYIKKGFEGEFIVISL
jgi:SAM-dependent methyltransferase